MEQSAVIPYRIIDLTYVMMSMSKELYQEIWVSNNYEIVFCTAEEKEQYMSLLSSKKVIPRGMSIVLINKKLVRLHTREEIMNATPVELKQMIK